MRKEKMRIDERNEELCDYRIAFVNVSVTYLGKYEACSECH